MTHQRERIPSYRLHKASGQAVVTLDGRDHYLGVHDSAADVHPERGSLTRDS